MNGTASCSLKVFLFLVISCNINHFHHTIKWYMFPSLYICSSPSCAWHISAHSCLKFDTNGGSSACRIWEHHLFFEISFLKITVYFKNIFLWAHNNSSKNWKKVMEIDFFIKAQMERMAKEKSISFELRNQLLKYVFYPKTRSVYEVVPLFYYLSKSNSWNSV